MKATIQVVDRNEGDLIRAGLDDPTVRAFAKVMGTLLLLPSDRARARVLQFVSESMAERAENG